MGVDRARRAARDRPVDAGGVVSGAAGEPARDREGGPARVARVVDSAGRADRGGTRDRRRAPGGSRTSDDDRACPRHEPPAGRPARASRSPTSSSRSGSASGWAARLRHIALIVARARSLAYALIVRPDDPADRRLPDPLGSSPVPITGQTFGVLLVGGALGFRRGSCVGIVPALGCPAVYAAAVGLDTFVSRDGKGGVGRPRRDRRLPRRVPRRRGGHGPAGRARLGPADPRRGRRDADRQRRDLPGRRAVAGMAVARPRPRDRRSRSGLTPFLVVDAIKLLLAAAAFRGRVVDRRAAAGRALSRVPPSPTS